MSDIISFQPIVAIDANGNQVPNATASFFDTGTTTPITVYADEGETTPHPAPLVADSSGVFPQVFKSGSAVKVVVKDAIGAVLYTVDPAIKVTAVGSSAGQISFSATTSIPSLNVQDAIVKVDQNRIDAIAAMGITGTAATGFKLAGPLDANGNTISWSLGADVASAAELLLLQDGNSVTLTGTTAVTSVETTADVIPIGTEYRIKAAGIITLTHHATDLRLITGADITTAVGDFFILRKYASKAWEMTDYTRADGAALVQSSSDIELLSVVTASASATVEFTQFNAALYGAYQVRMKDVLPATDTASLLLQVSSTGASPYDSGASDYEWMSRVETNAGGLLSSSSGDSSINLVQTAGVNGIGNASGEIGLSGTLEIYGPDQTKETRVSMSGVYERASAGQLAYLTSVGKRKTAAVVDAIQFKMTSGNITSGEFALYGIRDT